MAVERIDVEICTGCGICVSSCPMDVLRMDKESGRAIIRYPEDCMLCGWCIVDCPVDAVYVSPEKAEPLIVSWG